MCEVLGTGLYISRHDRSCGQKLKSLWFCQERIAEPNQEIELGKYKKKINPCYLTLTRTQDMVATTISSDLHMTDVETKEWRG